VITAESITDEQIRILYEEAYESVDDHCAYVAARALLREDHPSFNAKLRNEARDRCAAILNARKETP
jgi:hypothetical protein